MQKRIGSLHVITDEEIQNVFSHEALSELAIAGGADTIQFREKRKSSGKLVEVALRLASICRSAGATLIVNDRVDVALAADADGVHLGREDLPIAAAREILGPDKIIGGTAGSLEEALQVERDGADYVGFGHIFSTRSKEKQGAERGLQLLEQVCKRISIPVIAVGGIERSNAYQVMRAGARGVAVISYVCRSEDPRGAAEKLRELIDACLKES